MTIQRLIFSIAFFLLPLVTSAQNLAVTNLGNLSFGEEIFPGSSKKISRTEAGAASLKVSGESGREVHITFDLPASLTTPSADAMDVTFSPTSGGYHGNETAQSTSTAFDPNNGLITTLDSDGTIYLWLGGTVHPVKNQAGGNYTSDITANASYTTN